MDTNLMEFFSDADIKKPIRKLRLTSLFFTIGLLLMSVNLYIDLTEQFRAAQPHALGGAIMAFASSVLAQITES